MKHILSIFFIVFLLLFSCTESQYQKKALDLEETGNYIEAIKYWDKVIDVNPKNIHAYVNRAADKVECCKNYAGAIEDYNKALQIDSMSIVVYIGIARTKTEMKDFRGAINNYNKALKIMNFSMEGITISGQIKLPSFFSSDEVFEPITFSACDILSERGLVYLNIDSVKQAFNDFQYCIKHNEQLLVSYYGRGLIYLNTKEKDKAYSDFKKVINYKTSDNYLQSIIVDTKNILREYFNEDY